MQQNSLEDEFRQGVIDALNALPEAVRSEWTRPPPEPPRVKRPRKSRLPTLSRHRKRTRVEHNQTIEELSSFYDHTNNPLIPVPYAKVDNTALASSNEDLDPFVVGQFLGLLYKLGCPDQKADILSFVKEV